MNEDLKTLLVQTARLSNMVFCLKEAKESRGEPFNGKDAEALVVAFTEFVRSVMVPYFKSQGISKEQWETAVKDALSYLNARIKEVSDERRPEETH